LLYSFGPYALVGTVAILSLLSFRKPSTKPSTLCVGSALLLGGYVILRAFFSPNAYLARPDAYLAASALAVYLLTALYLTPSRFRMGVVLALFVVALAHVFVGGMQFTESNGFMLFGFNRESAYSFRASGMLLNPDHLAGFLEAVTLIALSFTVWGRHRLTTKFVIAYLTVGCLIGIAITGSRGGYLSLLAGLVVFVLLSLWVVRMYKETHFSMAFLGGIGGLLILVGCMVGFIKSTPVLNERLVHVDTEAKNVRWYHWLSTVDEFKLSPFFGNGSGTQLYYGRLFRRAQLQTDPQHANNDYLELLAEYGVVGGWLAAAFLIVHLGQGLHSIREITLRRLLNTFGAPRTDTIALTLGSMAAVIAILVHSGMDFNLHLPGNALLFAFIFGVLCNSGINPKDPVSPEKTEVFFRGALGVIGIGLLAAIAFRWHGEELSNQTRLALEMKNYDACARFAALAIQADPANADNYFYQGEALRAAANSTEDAQREGYFKQAIAAYRGGLKYFPQNENLWVNLGQCLDATSQWAEAEKAYNNAIASDPNLGVLYDRYAEHLRLTGDADGAQRCSDTARILNAAPSKAKFLPF
jgi:O-antigen ligase